jgi:hypothetical protein
VAIDNSPGTATITKPATPVPANQPAGIAAPGAGLAGANATAQGGILQALLGTISAGGQDQITQAQTAAGLQQQQLGIDRGLLGQDQGILGQQQGLDKQLLEQQLKGLGLSEDQSKAAAAQQRRGAASSATARGAVNTSGYGQQLTDIGQQLANQLAQYGVQGEEMKIGAQQTGLGHQQQANSLAAQLAGLGVQGQQIATGLQATQQNIATGVDESIMQQVANAISTGQTLSQDQLNSLGPILQNPQLLQQLLSTQGAGTNTGSVLTPADQRGGGPGY